MPAENIIVFAYDDIANNAQNPIPGQVFNHPDGDDVYAGVKIDYSGEEVTPENFLGVITGDESRVTAQTVKVLKTTEEDNVFIYFTDHGSVGLIAFPDEYLYAEDLMTALNTMHDKKMYKKLTFYLEACESGSMFEGVLPENMNIYATTAANPTESSWAEYCGSEAVVHGVDIGSCLGDEYSVRWMEDTESHDAKTRTLQEQFEFLVQSVTGSHPQQYGDLSWTSDVLIEFQGQSGKSVFTKILETVNYYNPFRSLRGRFRKGKVRSHDMRLYYFKKRAERSNDPNDEMNYYNELIAQERSRNIFKSFNHKFGLKRRFDSKKINYDCYKKSVEYYKQNCGMLIDRDYKFMRHIANFCTTKQSSWNAYHAFKEICENL
jgi:legumain